MRRAGNNNHAVFRSFLVFPWLSARSWLATQGDGKSSLLNMLISAGESRKLPYEERPGTARPAFASWN